MDQLEGLDEALSMGERFFIGHLLDHARLTRREKAMVKTHAGDETEASITGAMMELSSELEREAGFPIGQSESQLGGAHGEEHLIQRGFVATRFNKKDKPVLAAEVNDEVETQVSMEGIPEEPHGDDSMDDVENMPSDVLHAEHEALALQFKARRKMAEVKKMRNFYKRNEGRLSEGQDWQVLCLRRAGPFCKGLSQGQDGFGPRQPSPGHHCPAERNISR